MTHPPLEEATPLETWVETYGQQSQVLTLAQKFQVISILTEHLFNKDFSPIPESETITEQLSEGFAWTEGLLDESLKTSLCRLDGCNRAQLIDLIQAIAASLK
jgi:hypothetical protein